MSINQDVNVRLSPPSPPGGASEEGKAAWGSILRWKIRSGGGFFAKYRLKSIYYTRKNAYIIVYLMMYFIHNIIHQSIHISILYYCIYHTYIIHKYICNKYMKYTYRNTETNRITYTVYVYRNNNYTHSMHIEKTQPFHAHQNTQIYTH